MQAQVNGNLTGTHINDTTKLQFDTIEDTIDAFSTFGYPLLDVFIQANSACIIEYSKIVTRATASNPIHFGALQLISDNFILENGEFIIVLDSTDRENEGDLIIAAEVVTTEQMAFMIRYTR
jgi:hypothetical protein